jgi:hypothetical protein
MSPNVTIQPDLICDVRYRSRGAKDRRRRRCRHKARLRRAGTDCLLGAVVPDIQPVIPVQLDFCDASDRNRRTCSANVPLAAGEPRGCTDRLQRQSTRPPDGRLSNPTHHLNEKINAAARPAALRSRCPATAWESRHPTMCSAPHHCGRFSTQHNRAARLRRLKPWPAMPRGFSFPI